MSQIKKIIQDVLYVSKVTQTQNKKILTILSVFFSQITAYTDIAIIAVFSALIANQFTAIDFVDKIINYFIENKILIVLLVVARYIFQFYQKVIIYKIEHSVNKNLKVYLLSEIFDKRNYSIADSYFYINVLSQHISYFYSSFSNFLNNILQIFAYATYLIISDLEVVTIFGLGLIILFYPFKFLLRKSRNYMHESYIKGQESNQEVQRVVENLFLIKILKKDQFELDKFSNTLQSYIKNLFNNQKFGLLNSLMPSFLTLVTLSLILTSRIFSKSLSLDFIGVTLRMFQSLGNLTTSINQIINSHVHIEKFYEMEQNKSIQNKNNFIISKSEQITFTNVSFKYFNSEDFIFENINFSLYKNSHTLITGPNGSGKSTLLGLIAGVYFANVGTVASFSDKFGYIGTTPLIFQSSLRENLEYGNLGSFDPKKAINYLNYLETFKDQNNISLNMEISNKSLSSGQMQKIAFIRALLSDIDILLLDEATSNLDEESKSKIFEILQNNKITILNSTHEPEEFKGSDSNLVIETKNNERRINLIR